ncbi:MAG TPA: glycine amidinotransferase [Bdellovibrionales bacterium]|nr:MAG: hypothetical protein A2Z97_15550 [Bdellovibrionales bacterium GWB1_52_6]OFZ02905.1 MAG: hypothetical protein A2X97_04855 [Bdellovibrionales bacterium GWA1_52_35]OFZ37374.1 MAG: hypothetical protein A2070_03740 [Bdellovibrionales bacterium GWC1_52_8]HAR43754.1 glycine amidinotransferase [Bdellovibrionales bacterium]HCM38488.1 glycine amidinotransferase [Bdellovibrionales bacterium]
MNRLPDDLQKLNVYTEWGKLKEIIVGHCIDTDRVSVDTSFRLFYHQQIKDVLLKNSYELQKKMVQERQEDLDALQKTLESLDVRVRRPKRLEAVTPFATPHFQGHLTSVQNPRDQILIAGDEIIESSCVNRSRYFETDLLKEIFYGYFRAGARWTCAPRPMMREESFDYSQAQKVPGKGESWKDRQNQDSSFEMMFDAAQCLKFGKDIVMNVANANHALGADWLERHLQDRFRVHRVTLTDHHIDGMFMPLRPGVLLINPLTMHDKLDRLPEALKKWDVLTVPEADKTRYPEGSVLLASSNISVNVLPVDGNKVIVFDQHGSEHHALMKTLERKGFTPVPVRLRHSRVFDGGVHCATLDTVREDAPEDYFSG